MPDRRYGLYWNARGELYDVALVRADRDMCRIRNLTAGTESIQACAEALDRHIAVRWFVPCFQIDLDRAFARVEHHQRWQHTYNDAEESP
jgi:hypothetical protein